MDPVMAMTSAAQRLRTWGSAHEAGAVQPRSPKRRPLPRLVRIGLVLTGMVVLFAIAGPWVVDADPDEQNLAGRLAEPVFLGGSWEHPFGTDQLGRDLWVRMAVGARLSIAIGLAVTLLAGAIGAALGLAAAVIGRRLDRAIGFAVDVQIAVPVVVLAIAASALFTPGVAVVVGVLTFSGWVSYQRVVRAQTRALLSSPFVEASRSMGGSRLWIARKHLLPNAIGPVIVIASQQVAAVILFESALSYLGLGVPPETVTLGGMVAGGREAMLAAWWVPALPGGVIALIVLGLNLLGDGLRQHIDPRLQT
jgi:peptide/nickel transport system permease protein